jgi:hypothetical protein
MTLSRRDRAAMEWRPVVGFEGRYEVSDDGRVRTMLTRVPAHHMRELRSRANRHGYPVVTLRDFAGKTHCKTVHTLVARAFIGVPPDGMQVAHNDGDRSNAALENLRYATPKENQADRIRHGTGRDGDRNPSRLRPECLARGEQNGSSKLTAETVAAIRAERAEGSTQRELARKHGISQATAWAIVNRKAWAHVES